MTTPLLIALLLTFAQAAPPPDSDEDGAPPPTAAEQALPPEAGPAPTTPATGPLDTLVRTPVVRPFEMPPHTPTAPIPYAPVPAPVPADPVTVEHYQGDYEGSKDETQKVYARGVQSHFLAEQSMMGSLDGEWTVCARSGDPLFTVILIDAGGGAAVDGAWRDLRKSRASDGVGVMDAVERDHAGLTLRFHDGDRITPSVIHLTPDAGGRWRGELDDAGARQTVIMERRPATAPAS